jgi:hypothetical protein
VRASKRENQELCVFFQESLRLQDPQEYLMFELSVMAKEQEQFDLPLLPRREHTMPQLTEQL